MENTFYEIKFYKFLQIYGAQTHPQKFPNKKCN